MLIVNIVQTKLIFPVFLKENNNFLNKINDDKFSVADSVIFIQGNWIQMYVKWWIWTRIGLQIKTTADLQPWDQPIKA